MKKKTIDIPGADGLIDLSESLTGYPVYNNREGSFEFIVLNDFKAWYRAYSDISDYLHGKIMKAVLEDDPDYYYEGRFTVNDWKSNKDWSRIVIDYSVGPYKWRLANSLDDWEWDPFNFYTDVVGENEFKNIPVTTSYAAHTFTASKFGRAPVCPEFIVSTNSGSGMYIRFVNAMLGIDLTKRVQNGTVQIPEFLFLGDSVTLYFKCVSGTGTVSIRFRQGRL